MTTRGPARSSRRRTCWPVTSAPSRRCRIAATARGRPLPRSTSKIRSSREGLPSAAARRRSRPSPLRRRRDGCAAAGAARPTSAGSRLLDSAVAPSAGVRRRRHRDGGAPRRLAAQAGHQAGQVVEDLTDEGGVAADLDLTLAVADPHAVVGRRHVAAARGRAHERARRAEAGAIHRRALSPRSAPARQAVRSGPARTVRRGTGGGRPGSPGQLLAPSPLVDTEPDTTPLEPPAPSPAALVLLARAGPRHAAPRRSPCGGRRQRDRLRQVVVEIRRSAEQTVGELAAQRRLDERDDGSPRRRRARGPGGSRRRRLGRTATASASEASARR